MSKFLDFLKKCATKIKDIVLWVWFRILRVFEDHKYLHVTHTKYNSEGEVVDVLIKSFTVRKFYKQGPKHMSFKTYDGTYVELKTATPMDYMTETIIGDAKTFD